MSPHEYGTAVDAATFVSVNQTALTPYGINKGGSTYKGHVRPIETVGASTNDLRYYYASYQQ